MGVKRENIKQFYNTTIPYEWQSKRFKSFANFYSGGTPKTTNPEYYNGDIPFIKSGEIYFDHTKQFISKEGLDNSSAKIIDKGDILFALYGANSGEVAISKIKGAINQAILCVKQNENCDTIFLYNYLLSQKERIIRNYLQGGQGNLSADIVKTLIIPLPPLPEQKAIAKALGLMDKAININNKLIAQKEMRKKWLMQNLLSGKKRLKGFSGEWEEVKLGDLLDYQQPTKYLVENTIYNNSYSIPVLTAGKTFILGYTNENEGICRDLPIIIFDDFTTSSKYVDFPFKVKSSAMKLLKSKPNVNLKFIYGAMQLIKFEVGGHQRHWISKFTRLTISCPPFKEQTAIAQILMAIDKELNLLRVKTEKLKEQKKGMMQVLLTGEKRLNLDLED